MIEWPIVGYLTILSLATAGAFFLGWRAGNESLKSAERVWKVTKDHTKQADAVARLNEKTAELVEEQKAVTNALLGLTKKVHSLLMAFVQSGTIKAARIGEEMIGEQEHRFEFPRTPGPPPVAASEGEHLSERQNHDSTQPPSGWGVDPDQMRPHQGQTRRRASAEKDTPI